jgi:two-component sensor histidine kinase
MPYRVGDIAIGLARLLTPELQSLIAEKVAALRSEAGLGAILDGIGEGFYAVDRDWLIILFNEEAARHFRRPPQEMLGRMLWDALAGARETDLGRLFHKVMASRETIRSETESVVFPGRWLAYRLFPLGDGMGVVFRDVTDRKRAEAQRDLLIRELHHRVKNTLATVQAIAAQTFRHEGVEPSVQATFEGRLLTLSAVHSVLTDANWASAELHDVVASTLRPHRAPGRERFAVQGPALRLRPQSAVALSMALHELCTNAIKYGALSVDAGRVDLQWRAADGRFRLRWQELDGPPVAEPRRRGFGSRLIERSLAAQLQGDVVIDFQPAGVVCTIDAPLDAVSEETAKS